MKNIKTKKLMDFKRLTDNNMRFITDYEFDTTYDCQSESSCCDGDYCRCGRIVNAIVPYNTNNSYNIAKVITKNKTLINDFRFYCLERLTSYLLRENTDCFDVSISGGYYGEEVDHVTLNWDVINVINNFIEELNKNKTKDHCRSLE